MPLKKRVIDAIIAREKGYVFDPNDSGGETNFGITVAVARDWGYTGPMREMPRAVAETIYAARYWDALCLDGVAAISEAVAAELADTGVNMGVGRAATFLQRSLNAFNKQASQWPDLKVDGALGSKTIRALSAYFDHRRADAEPVLLKALNALQGEKYIALAEAREKDESFVFGWIKNRT